MHFIVNLINFLIKYQDFSKTRIIVIDMYANGKVK